MELRQLRYFVAIFEHRSVSRAAEHLRISQPALTRQLHQLERQLGTVLFERVTTGVVPTPGALALHEHATAVLRLADASREVVRSAGPAREIVRTGLPPGMSTSWLDAKLRALKDKVPSAAIAFTDASSIEQLRMLRAGHLDLALVHQRPPDQVAGRLLYDQPFGLAMRPGHPLAGRTRFGVADLDELRVLAHSRDQVTTEHDQISAAARALGLHPDWVFAWFTENALACATASEADAVLLTEPSAKRLLPEWPWAPLTDPGFALPTWLARQAQVRTVVTQVAEVLAA
ncbi:LysR family transcriptional regulator [Amycolatopsis acidicola]|uniref:LysR family transcriptional regulator n=1 Tax=Amycolatopsis acidicola TaxID=2596893 RepID=A0A5N0UWG4_9PSEU|nr:LysR family transcriptional regulator [Amycolatopsis acidicola]KAA9155280.1 LysR family transcriptional regulator [Amycolatopsis acidicola]